MPRSKKATPEQVGALLASTHRRLIEAVLNPRAKRLLQKHANELAHEWRLCQVLLTVVPNLSRKQREELFRLDEVKLTADFTGHAISVDDIQLIRDMGDELVNRVLGRPRSGRVTPKRVGRYLMRLGSRTNRPRKRQEKFVTAFEARARATREGKKITDKALAEQLTPDAYDRNPESAIRAMAAGVKRVEEERRRLSASQRKNKT